MLSGKAGVDKALFIGGSNASKLASATAMLGVDTSKIAKGGWKVTTSSVDLLIQDLEEQLSGMPPDSPIILYCMDNSAFMGVSSDGSMTPLAKTPGGESGYHANGELIVAPDRALVTPIGNLKRLAEACGDHPVFVISPHFRFVRGPCCYAAGHMTNFGDPNFIREMVKDLSRVFHLLRRSLPNVKVIEGMELICGKNYNLEKATSAATSCWTGDVIHPTNHTYAKMALHLLEAIAPQNPAVPPQAGSSRGGGGGGNSRKRTHSDCDSLSRNSSREGDRSRNWAEQRRDQARVDQYYYPAPYPAPYPALPGYAWSLLCSAQFLERSCRLEFLDTDSLSLWVRLRLLPPPPPPRELLACVGAAGF